MAQSKANMMFRKWISISLLCLATIVLLRQGAAAQLQFPNVAPQQTLGKHQWVALRGDHLDILVPDKSYRDLAQHALHLAEAAHHEFRRYFEFMASTRCQLYLYPSPIQYRNLRQGATFDDRRSLHINIGSIYHPGTLAELRKVIRTELVSLLLEDMYYGLGVQYALQNRLLLHVPQWYSQGLSTYLGEGWTAQDEAILRSLPPETRYAHLLLEEPNHPAAPTLFKSIWLYTEQTYGPKKIAEIAYMTRLTRSVNGGFISVLGLSLAAYTDRWENALRAQIKAPSFPPLADSLRVTLPRRQTLLRAEASPSGTWVAALTQRGSQLGLQIYTPATRSWAKTNLSIKLPTWEAPQRLLQQLPLAWRPDGKWVAAVLPTPKGLALAVYETDSRRTTWYPLNERVDWVQSMAWHPSGKNLVVAASLRGQSDLFLFTPGGGLSPLTQDAHDDTDPAWHPSGSHIVFASTRDTALALGNTPLDYRMVGLPGGLYALPMPAKGQRLSQLLPPANHHVRRPQYLGAQGDTLVWLSDTSGLWQQQQAPTLALPGGPPLPDLENAYSTQVQTGVLGTQTRSQGASGILLSSHHLGQPAIWTLRNLTWHSTPPTTLGARTRALRFSQWRYAVQPPALPAPDTLPPPADSFAPPLADTLAPEPPAKTDSTPPVRFYVFDEADTPDEQPDRKPRRRNFSSNVADIAPERPFDISQLQVYGFRELPASINLLYGLTRFGVDPLWGLNVGFYLALQDAPRYHQVQALARGYRDFRSFDLGLDYRFSKWRRVHLTGHFELQSRHFIQPQIFRYTSGETHIGAALPLGRGHQLYAQTGITHLYRRDLRLTDASERSGEAVLAHFELAWQLARLQMLPHFIQRGSSIDIRIRSPYSFQRQDFVFQQVWLDARRYSRLPGDIVWANRLAGGFGFGPERGLFFLGGNQNWINQTFNNREDVPVGEAVEAFHYSQIVTPLAGFDLNARNGDKTFLYNSELRFPIYRLFATSLPHNPLYNIQWSLFYHVGTAWSRGNPLSQRNPINESVITRGPITATVQSLRNPFIQAFGTGIGTIILGYYTRLDLAWGIEDGDLVQPRVLLYFGTEF